MKKSGDSAIKKIEKDHTTGDFILRLSPHALSRMQKKNSNVSSESKGAR